MVPSQEVICPMFVKRWTPTSPSQNVASNILECCEKHFRNFSNPKYYPYQTKEKVKNKIFINMMCFNLLSQPVIIFTHWYNLMTLQGKEKRTKKIIHILPKEKQMLNSSLVLKIC